VFTIASLLSSLSAAAFVPDATLTSALPVAWGQSRSLMAFLMVWTIARLLQADDRKRVVQVFLLFTFGECAVAAVQSLGANWIRQLTVEYYSRKLGYEITDAVELGRAFGTFDGQPNVLGVFCVLALSFTVSEAVETRGIRRFASLATSIVVAWALAVSWSRGAYSGAAVAVLIVLWHKRKGGTGVTALAAACVAVTAIYVAAPEAVKERFEQLVMNRGTDASESLFATRQAVWMSNMRLFEQHPVLGVRGIPMDPADNLYVALLALNGVIGFVLFFVALALTVREIRKQQVTNLGRIAVPLLAATVGWMVNGVSIGSFFGERVQELYWVFAALTLAPLREVSHQLRDSRHARSRARMAAVARTLGAQ